MKHGLDFPVALGVLTMLVALLWGCGGTSAPSEFYILNSLPDPVEKRPIPAADGCFVIGLGPVSLPKYVDRPEIVTRVSPNRLEVAGFDRWAEPVTGNFTRVMAENLSTVLCTDRVVFYPWPRATAIDYQINVEVVRMDGSFKGDAVLTAKWSISGKDGEKVLLSKRSSFSRPATPDTYEGFVAALSETVADLSREVAEGIRAVSRGMSR
jgi:uncharacterized lipoprotein YmbA